MRKKLFSKKSFLHAKLQGNHKKKKKKKKYLELPRIRLPKNNLLFIVDHPLCLLSLCCNYNYLLSLELPGPSQFFSQKPKFSFAFVSIYICCARFISCFDIFMWCLVCFLSAWGRGQDMKEGENVHNRTIWPDHQTCVWISFLTWWLC